MEEMIKNLAELKPLKECDTTLEVTPSSSRAASTKSTKRQTSSSSDTSESDAENKKHAAEKLCGLRKINAVSATDELESHIMTTKLGQ
ncbi:unnamed protein product [Cylicocyclus nassatus]|uniref:Uncharacterized protein n=1 Tax=Cylicocyclus nassatus TaxID=53992 RepID=A0AA36GUH8_CYLNA|nr:unnamed protein product [Cylicocyclus nassatus]